MTRCAVGWGTSGSLCTRRKLWGAVFKSFAPFAHTGQLSSSAAFKVDQHLGLAASGIYILVFRYTIQAFSFSIAGLIT